MKKIAVVLVALFSMFLSVSAQQQGATQSKVLDAYGQTQRRISRNPERWSPLAVGDTLAADSAVRTGTSSAILLQLPDRHAIRVGASTTLELKETGNNGSFSFQLIAGEIWSFVNKARRPTRYEVDTPTAVLGVRGTVFHVEYDDTDNEADVSVSEGEVSLTQEGATQAVEKGYEMRVGRNQLRQSRPARHSPATQQMWRLLLRENWANANTTGKLDRQSDLELQKLKQQVRAAVVRRRQQAAQAAARERAQQEEKAGKAAKTPARGNRR